MANSYKGWFILLLLASTLFSCTDHRLGGALSPARLRLKSYSDGDGTTTYTYDAQNQPSTITRNGVVSTIMYGDPQRLYTSSDQEANHIFYVIPDSKNSGQGVLTIYPPALNGTNFTAIQYGYSPSIKIYYSARLRYYDYAFDESKRLIRYTNRSDYPIDINSYSYKYTGDNITTEGIVLSAGHGGIYTATYTYDDKINPFYGLLDPNIDPRLRSTRNNQLTSQTRYGNDVIMGPVGSTASYVYEYNAQNLPTKRTIQTTLSGNAPTTSITTFTYESY